MKATDQKGFGAVEVLLIAVVVGILGFTGYYVWHSQSETNKAYDDAGKSENASLEYIKDSTQADFEACKKAAGSRMLQTYPEQCVTKDGKVYTTAAVTPSTISQSDAQNYLIIKEWGVKVPLSSGMAGATYYMKNKYTLITDAKLSSFCEAGSENQMNAVAVAHGQATDLVPSETSDDGRTFASLAADSPQQVYAKLGNYYFVRPDFGGASCASDTSGATQEETERDNIITALKAMRQE